MQETVDVYCGCGGLTLGAQKAGFATKLAIDLDPILTSSFLTNFPGAKLMLADMSTADVEAIARKVGPDVAGVIGGPPCQAFSEIGRSHLGDPRRDLVHHFFRLVAAIRPKFFLMENVRGLGFERHISILQQGLDLVADNYEIRGPLLLDAADFGAATSRPRLFVFGFDTERMDAVTEKDIEAAKRAPATVKDAISDLRKARYRFDDEDGFDVWRHDLGAFVPAYASPLRRNRRLFTGHRRTAHAKATVKRFSSVEPGSRDPVGKHSRLAWNRQSPTLRAGTGSDHGSYQSVRPIHPSEDRVITVREGARLQGFHDGFLFHPSTWHSFRMIGNSVSPIIAKALLSVVASRLAASAEVLEAAE